MGEYRHVNVFVHLCKDVIAVCLLDLELLEKNNYDKFHNEFEIVVDGSRSLQTSRIWKVFQQCIHFLLVTLLSVPRTAAI